MLIILDLRGDKLQYKNITKTNNRFFIDVGKNCGSGCSYCYLEGNDVNQRVFEKKYFLDSLNSISLDNDYRNGKEGSIITLSPNTEPFKTQKSINLVKEVLAKFCQLRNRIQIATKEKISEKIFKYINKKMQYKKQVLLSVSMPITSKQKTIEPFTADIDERLNNLKLAKDYKVATSLYIKPILKETINDRDKFIEIAKDYNPDFICVGMKYKKRDKEDKGFDTLYKNKSHYKHLMELPSNSQITSFTNELRKRTGYIVFNCSVCIMAELNQSYPIPMIWREFPELCVECKNCEKQYQQSLELRGEYENESD